MKVPKLALGTWLMDDAQSPQAVKEAISMGYRYIDTAQAYGNEQGVGEGVRLSGVGREQIFITSKVAAEHKSYQTAADSIDGTLRAMEDAMKAGEVRAIGVSNFLEGDTIERIKDYGESSGFPVYGGKM